jgi:hypothetical protein
MLKMDRQHKRKYRICPGKIKNGAGWWRKRLETGNKQILKDRREGNGKPPLDTKFAYEILTQDHQESTQTRRSYLSIYVETFVEFR